MGLFDAFQGLGNLNQEQSQGLLSAAAQLLQQSGPSRTPTSFGQIIGGGLGAYQQSTDASRKRKLEEEREAQLQQLRQLEIQSQTGQMQQQGSAREQQAAIDQLAQGSVINGKFDQDAFLQGVQKINPLRALEYQQKLAKVGPEFDTKPQTAIGPDGKPFQYIIAKNGEMKRLDGALPRDELKLANLGGKDIAYNPFALQEGQTFQRTMTPDGAASNAIARENLGISRQRLLMDQQANAGGGKAPAGYRWASNGELEAIPGGPASKAATATEGERKAATLLMRLQGSEAQLEKALKTDPAAAKPGVIAQGLRSIGGESAANSFAVGPERQQVEAAQLDILDAALTLGTGAAYTKEQLEGYRKSYFPQIGDKPGTVKDKQARLDNVIEAAKIAAGRAGKNIEDPRQASQPVRKSVLKGQVIDGYRFKGGDPADQNNWEKR